MNKIFTSILFLLTPLVSFAHHDEGEFDFFNGHWPVVIGIAIVVFIGYRVTKKYF